MAAWLPSRDRERLPRLDRAARQAVKEARPPLDLSRKRRGFSSAEEDEEAGRGAGQRPTAPASRGPRRASTGAARPGLRPAAASAPRPAGPPLGSPGRLGLRHLRSCKL